MLRGGYEALRVIQGALKATQIATLQEIMFEGCQVIMQRVIRNNARAKEKKENTELLWQSLCQATGLDLDKLAIHKQETQARGRDTGGTVQTVGGEKVKPTLRSSLACLAVL